MIREYVCDECGEVFEYIQKYSDPPKTECELCKKDTLVENKLTLSNFVLSGTGWFKTGGY